MPRKYLGPAESHTFVNDRHYGPVILDELTEYISDEWSQNDQLIWKRKAEVTSNGMEIRTEYG
ncbi:hypothetical protein D1872_350150 [compost metagenome]